VVAETTPLIAWSGPVRLETVKFEAKKFEEVALPTMLRFPFTVVEPTETRPFENVSVVEVALPGKR
jgi:hypothetical protein